MLSVKAREAADTMF